MKKLENKKLEKKIRGSLRNMKWATDTSRVKFSYLGGINRPINPGHVSKIAKSIYILGMLRVVICTEVSFITGKKELYVLDGQHGLNGALRNGDEIPYVVIQIDSKQELIEALALLNNSSKVWSMLDYITAWSCLNPDYIKLNHYYQVYDFDLCFLASVFMSLVDGGNISKKIKHGEFKVSNESNCVDILDKLTDVFKIINRLNRKENTYVCREYVKFVKNSKDYDHKKFLSNLTKNKKKFELATHEQSKLAEMFNKLV